MPSSKSNLKPKSNSLPQPLYEWSFEAIGTQWWIGLYNQADVTTLKWRISDRIELFDKIYSRFRTDSMVTHMQQQSGTYVMPADATKMLALYRQLYNVTGGSVTPLIGGLLSDTGYDANYSLQPKELRTVPLWQDIMTVNGHTITLHQPALLDFGAAGKGYLVDIIGELLAADGVEAFCIDASGDIYCKGIGEPLRIGLENPDNTQQVIGTTQLQNQALCSSAPNRRQWGNYHHIVDPKLKESPRHLKAVWVLADTAMLADGLTTALFFTPADVLRKTFKFDYALLYADGRFERSLNFNVELY